MLAVPSTKDVKCIRVSVCLYASAPHLQNSVGFVLLTGGQRDDGGVASYLDDVWSMTVVDGELTWQPLSPLYSPRYVARQS